MAGTSNVRGLESVTFTDNMSFDGTDRGGKMISDGQLWIGATASNRANDGGHVRLGNIVAAPGSGIIVLNGPGNIIIGITGGQPANSFDVQANTAPGVDPVTPTAAGVITVNGAVVAAHSVPLETRSRALNAYNVEVQYAAAVAATDGTKSGVAHFDSDIFTVDSVGFVSTTAGSLVQTITGGPGITITGTASDPIVNSVVFTDTTAITMAVDNGYFATAAGTYVLPATAAQGELIHIVCDTAGAVVVDAPALNFIRIGNQISSSGGTVTSSAIGDSLTLRYRLSTLTWYATGYVGNWSPA